MNGSQGMWPRQPPILSKFFLVLLDPLENCVENLGMSEKLTGNNYLVGNGDKNLKLASNQIVQKLLCHTILEEL